MIQARKTGYYAYGFFLLGALAGCAGPNQVAARAPRLAFDELSHEQAARQVTGIAQQPVVLHFKKGHTIPLGFMLDSRLLDLPLQEMKLQVKHDFYLLLRADGPPLLSEDGIEFEERPKNRFMFGFALLKGQAPRVNVRIGLRPESQ